MKFLSPGSSTFLHVLLLPLVICLLYLNTLHAPFVLDDSQIFETNTAPVSIFSWQQIKKISSSSFHPRRLFPNISFAWNYSLGGNNPTGYHWGNIAIHCGVALMLYFLFCRILALSLRGGEMSRYREIAFMAALLWAVHPLQTNAVTYIIQRMTSMAALFYLLSILCYFKARQRGVLGKGWYFFALTLLFGLMALFSKENSAILPISLLGCELFFLQQGPAGIWWTKRNMVFAGLLVSGFICICLLMLGTNPLAGILEGYRYRDFTLGQRLMTEPRVLFHYLSLLVLPLPSRLNIAYDFPLSTGFFSPPQTLAAIAGLAGLTAAVALLYNRDRLSAFALFWFLVNLVIESSFIPLMIIFEHRMYLPSMFLVCAGVAWCYRLAGNKVNGARGVVVSVIILFALFTWQRNGVWRSEVGLWSDVVAKSPGLSWGHANLGKAYAELDQYGLAEEQLRKGIALDPGDGLAYLNLGVMYERQNRLPEANLVLNKALDTKLADHAGLFINLAIVNYKMGNFRATIDYANRVLKLRPDRYKPYDILGAAYLKVGEPVQAEKIFTQAVSMFPRKGDPYLRLAAVYEKQNRLPEAIATLQKVFVLKDVNLARAYNQLGIVYWRMHNLPESIRAAQQALQIDPAYKDAYLTLGISYEDSGQMELAVSEFNRGWQAGLDMVGIYNNWAENQMRNNDPDRAIIYLQQAVRLEPDRVISHRNLSRAYAQKGAVAEAEREEKLARQLEAEKKDHAGVR